MLAVFSGYNQRAVISFLRCLRKNHVDDYAIVASSSDDPIFCTCFSNKVAYTRRIKELDIDEFIYAINQLSKLTDGEAVLVPPTTEALNRFLLENRALLERCNCVIPLVDAELYRKLSDKQSFWELCIAEGLCVPRLVDIDDIFSYPVVAKPRVYKSKSGSVHAPIIINNDHDLTAFFHNYNKDDFLWQEYIDGRSYYLLYYFSRSGKVWAFSQENYAQQPEGKSILAASASNLHTKEISEQYIFLLRKNQYHGFVMIELREHKSRYYMIEANPRFWGPSQLFLDAGALLFEAFLVDYGYVEEMPREEIRPDTKYFWRGGLKGDILEDTACCWHGDGRQKVLQSYEEFLKSDIYNRPDTEGIYFRELRAK